jgi:ankyrin repeat protein
MYLDLCAIKYICVLLSSLALASCSSLKFDDQNMVEFKNGNDEKATFNDLRYDIIRHIATFMEPEDIVNLRYVNSLTLSSLSLKKLVEQAFNISGLESIADNEPELAGVMRLAHDSHDHMLLFKALINDIICEKKPYNVLFSPLILHLFKTFSGLDFQEKQELQQSFEVLFNRNVETCIIKACIRKGNFDLAIGIIKDNADLSGKALRSAAHLGHANIVEILLQGHTDIPAYYVGWALRGASKNGHTLNVQLILQYCNDISVDHAGSALDNAATNGHTSIVELLLQRHNDISVDHAGSALDNASKNGHASIVDLLLHHRTDISAQDAGSALENAATNGHTSIVGLLLQNFTDIPAKNVGWALLGAAKNEHTSIFELLLQSRTDIPANFVGSALARASKNGFTSIVEPLLQLFTDIPAKYVGWALEGASKNGHTSIVELIRKHQLNINP